MTIPLGVLKADGIRFASSLPERHTEALARLKTKSLEKVMSVFEKRSWNEDISQISLLDDPSGFVWTHDLSPHAGAMTLVGLHSRVIASKPVAGNSAAGAFATLVSEMFGSMPDHQHGATTDCASGPYSLGAYSYIPVGGVC